MTKEAIKKWLLDEGCCEQSEDVVVITLKSGRKYKQKVVEFFSNASLDDTETALFIPNLYYNTDTCTMIGVKSIETIEW